MADKGSWVDTAESAITGFFHSIKRFFTTLGWLANPLYWPRLPFTLNRASNRSRLLPPLLFLSIGSFLLARVVRFTYDYAMSPNPTETTLRNFIQVEDYSITKIILTVLPIIVFAVIVSRFTSWLLVGDLRQRRLFFNFLCYVFGYYASGWFFWALFNGVVLVLQERNPGTWITRSSVSNLRMLIVVLGISYVLFSPPILVAIGVWRFNRQNSTRTKIVKTASAVGLFLFLMLGSYAAQFLKIDTDVSEKPTPAAAATASPSP